MVDLQAKDSDRKNQPTTAGTKSWTTTVVVGAPKTPLLKLLQKWVILNIACLMIIFLKYNQTKFILYM